MARNRNKKPIPRREFLKTSAVSVGTIGTIASDDARARQKTSPSSRGGVRSARQYNGNYFAENLNRVAFPLGGIGAGMICLEGTGALSHFSLRNKPEVFNEPCTFAAISIKGEKFARVVEGPVPAWKKFGSPGTGNGAGGTSFGLPRFAVASFNERFPFATVTLREFGAGLDAEITGWSPFEPGDADNACLPVAALEYDFTNTSSATRQAVFSFSAKNFMAVGKNPNSIRPAPGGFKLWGGASEGKPEEEGAFCAAVTDPEVKVNHAWFRGGCGTG